MQQSTLQVTAPAASPPVIPFNRPLSLNSVAIVLKQISIFGLLVIAVEPYYFAPTVPSSPFLSPLLSPVSVVIVLRADVDLRPAGDRCGTLLRHPLPVRLLPSPP